MNADGMSQQAQHIWSMLDDMATNDPNAYRKFIDKNIKEGKEYMTPPMPHMCLQTVILSDEKKTQLFINVCDWPRVPAPKSDVDPIPVVGGSMMEMKDELGLQKVITVAFNPKVLEQFGRYSKLTEERKMLINLAIDYVQDQHSLRLSRNYTVLDENIKHKGALQEIQRSLTKKTKGSDEKFEEELGELEKSFGPLASGCKDSLLNKLSNISVEENQPQNNQSATPLQSSNQSNIAMQSSQSEIRLPSSAPKKTGLIQEIDSSTNKLEEPKSEIKISSEESRQFYEIKIHLPGVKSVKECDLDVSEVDLHLVVDGKYETKLNFDQKVIVEEANAKFSKKSSTLTVTVPQHR